VAKANTEDKHPFLRRSETVRRVGAVVVTTDKGLCGGLNTNILRLVLNQHKEWRGKGLEFLTRMGGNVVSHAVQLGDRPKLDKLIGPVKVLLDKFIDGSVDEI